MLRTLCGGEINRTIILKKAKPELSRDARSALRTAAGEAMEFENLLAAAAEVALADRLDATRADWGLQSRGMPCLIVIDRDSFADFDDFMLAAARYFKHLAVIEFNPASVNPWRLVQARHVDSVHPLRRARLVEPAAREHPTAQHRGAPALRLVNGEIPLEPASHNVDDSSAESATGDLDQSDESIPRVSRDEIAMLLRDDAPMQETGLQEHREMEADE